MTQKMMSSVKYLTIQEPVLSTLPMTQMAPGKDLFIHNYRLSMSGSYNGHGSFFRIHEG